jgi:hypothetical protein
VAITAEQVGQWRTWHELHPYMSSGMLGLARDDFFTCQPCRRSQTHHSCSSLCERSSLSHLPPHNNPVAFHHRHGALAAAEPEKCSAEQAGDGSVHPAAVAGAR